MTGCFLRSANDHSLVRKVSRVPTGCETLDQLLDGGIETGTITLLYGPPGSGKTNVALSSAVTTAASGRKVLYIDTEGISPGRLQQYIDGREENDVEAIADRIVVRSAHNFDEQISAVKDAQTVKDDVDLIVIDSLTGFYRLERTSDDRDGDALRSVTRQVTHLLSIARKCDLAVIATNQVFTDPEAGGVRPLGGHTLAHWAGAVIRLDRFRGGNRRATLEKHRSLPAGDTAAFRISEHGLLPIDRLG